LYRNQGKITLRIFRIAYEINLVDEGKVALKPFISKHFPFKDYLKAYQYIDENRETTMKVIIDVQEP
jgi:L-iditol 2-dehydrogenase